MVAGVLDCHVPPLGEPAKAFEVARVISGVGDGEEALVVEQIGEKVVDHASVLLTEEGVLGATDGDRRDVVGQE